MKEICEWKLKGTLQALLHQHAVAICNLGYILLLLLLRLTAQSTPFFWFFPPLPLLGSSHTGVFIRTFASHLAPRLFPGVLGPQGSPLGRLLFWLAILTLLHHFLIASDVAVSLVAFCVLPSSCPPLQVVFSLHVHSALCCPVALLIKFNKDPNKKSVLLCRIQSDSAASLHATCLRWQTRQIEQISLIWFCLFFIFHPSSSHH